MKQLSTNIITDAKLNMELMSIIFQRKVLYHGDGRKFALELKVIFTHSDLPISQTVYHSIIRLTNKILTKGMLVLYT